MKNDPAQILKSKRGEILRIAAQHGARNVRVFGSVARGEADPQSDVDLRWLKWSQGVAYSISLDC